VVEAHPDDRTAIRLVATIDELFAIDAQARKQNLTLSQRDGLRQQLAPSILESIKSQIQTARRNLPSVENPHPQLARFYVARPRRVCPSAASLN
jgi:hypothetical protein